MTESRAVSVVLAVGVLTVGLVLLLAVGPLAGLAFVYVCVICLIFDRSSLFARLDEVWEDTDKALVNSAAAVEAVEELRGWLVEFRAAFEADTDDLNADPAVQVSSPEPEPGPSTQPIELPEPQGPPTEPVTEVAARQVRALMDNAPAEDEWRTRFTFADGGRR